MKHGAFVAALAVACTAQVGLPAWKVYQQLDLMRNAPRFLCRAQPIDPVDPLRGRYIAIDLDELDTLPLDALPGEDPQHHSGWAHLVFSEGQDGFAEYRLEREKPEGEAWIRVSYHRSGNLASVNRHSLPFTRYYVEESRAPRAEEAYRRSAGQAQAWIALRVRRGDASLEELYVDGLPIGEWLSADAAEAADAPSVAPAEETRADLPEQDQDGKAERKPGGLEEPLGGGQEGE